MKSTLVFALLLLSYSLSAKEIFVAPLGNDGGAGSKESPFASFERALEETRKFAGKEALTVWFEEGSYYLDQTLRLGHEYSGSPEHPVIFSALPGARLASRVPGNSTF